MAAVRGVYATDTSDVTAVYGPDIAPFVQASCMERYAAQTSCTCEQTATCYDYIYNTPCR